MTTPRPRSGGAGSPRLEVVSRAPRGTRRGPPIVLVHGAYFAAWVWAEHFLDFFAGHGHLALAPSLRGHGESTGREALASASLADYVEDLRAVVEGLDEPPVLVGHSMGGLVVQKYLLTRPAAGAVLMASVPPWGLGPACAEIAWREPRLLLDSAQAPLVGPGGMAGDSVAEALFGDRLEPALLARYLGRAQPESARVMLDMLGLDLPWRPMPPDLPMLVLGAGRDGFFPAHTVRATALVYGAPVQVFPEMAHTMMLEPDWRPVAEAVLAHAAACQTAPADRDLRLRFT